MKDSNVPRGTYRWCNLSNEYIPFTPEVRSVTLQHTGLIKTMRL